MKETHMRARQFRNHGGFSLVELLAVVLVLAVLATVALPVYSSQRKSASGRLCKANMAAICAAAAGYAFHNGAYPPSLTAAQASGTGLVGGPAGLQSWPKCPLKGIATQAYSYTISNGALTISCPNHSAFSVKGGSFGEWTRTLSAPCVDGIP